MKNYYPLRIGNNSNTIVSDVPTNSDPDPADVKYYGGYLVCESCPPSIAKQLIDAYNEKHGCTDKKNPCTGGRMCCQSKISHHAWMEQEEGKRENPLKEFLLQSSTFKIKVMAPSWDQVAGLIHLLKLKNNSTTKWESGMTCDATIIIGYLRDDLTPKIETAADKQNSAHSFTEGADVPPLTGVTIKGQLAWLDYISKYYSTTPGKEAIEGDVDVEKVITDLLALIKDVGKQIQWPPKWIETAEQVQNAEAALGMLRAFKEEREKWNPAKVREAMAKQPIVWVNKSGVQERISRTASPESHPSIKIICEELHLSAEVFNKFIGTDLNVMKIHEAAKVMVESLRSGHKLMSIGNGGSFSDAQHFASELSGKYRKERPAIAAMALSDGGAMSCIANDFGYGEVFRRQVEAIGREGDVLLCLSTSGNSENIVLAAERARQMGITVVAITGEGGKLKADILIEVPYHGDAGKIQELTITIIHILVNLIERGVAL